MIMCLCPIRLEGLRRGDFSGLDAAQAVATERELEQGADPEDGILAGPGDQREHVDPLVAGGGHG